MTLFDRLMLTIYTFCLTIFSIFAILISLRVLPVDFCWTTFKGIYGRWETGLTGLVFLIVSLKFLLSGIKGNKYNQMLISTTSLGEISISLVAIENTVIKTVKEIIGVKDVEVKIRNYSDGIRLILKLNIIPDVNIPEITTEIQKNVKEYVETTTGIKIKEIKVLIGNIATNIKSRVS